MCGQSACMVSEPPRWGGRECELALEVQAQSGNEGAELGRHVLLPLSEATSSALERSFRLEALVVRPRVEIAPGDAHRRSRCAQPAGEHSRQTVAERDLA